MNLKIFFVVCISNFCCGSLVNCLPNNSFEKSRVRRAASEADDLNDKSFSRVYDTGKGGEMGYLRKKAEKHDRGYELYDSFHKKHADDFEYDNGHKKQSQTGAKDEEEKSGATHSEIREYEDKPKKKAIFTEGYEVTEQHEGGDGDHNTFHSGNAKYEHDGAGHHSQHHSDEADEYDDDHEESSPYIKSTPIGDYVYHQDDEEDDY